MNFKEKFNLIIGQIDQSSRTFLDDNKDDISLFNGLSGVSLFYFHLYKCTKNIIYKELSEQFIHKAIIKLNNNLKVGFTFSLGMSGFCWLLVYYKKNKFLNFVSERYLNDIDIILLDKLKNGNDRFIYDFFNGYIGYGLYFLERNNKNTNQAIKLITRHLDDSKISNNMGFIWKSIDWDDLRKTQTKKDDLFAVKYNLGLAHGLPSIISFLSMANSKGYETNLTKNLIVNGSKYIDNLLCEINDTTNIIPTIIKANDEVYRGSRLAWCYSSLSSSIVLLNASKAINSEELYSISKKLALNATQMAISSNGSSTEEVGFCHGSSGCAYMFNKLFKNFNNVDMDTAAQLFYEKIIITQQDVSFGSAGFASFKFDNVKQDYYSEKDFGLLNGTAGIGLVLLSYLYPEIEPTWDRCLLLS